MNFTEFYNKVRNKVSNHDGMLLIHNGIVKAINRDGQNVEKIYVEYNKQKLDELINKYSSKKGISFVEVYINQGELKVGDDIMFLAVCGDVRENVISTLQDLLDEIKKYVTSKREVLKRD